MHVVRAKKMEGFIMRKKLLSILCAFSLVLTPVPVSAETVQEINPGAIGKSSYFIRLSEMVIHLDR